MQMDRFKIQAYAKLQKTQQNLANYEQLKAEAGEKYPFLYSALKVEEKLLKMKGKTVEEMLEGEVELKRPLEKIRLH